MASLQSFPSHICPICFSLFPAPDHPSSATDCLAKNKWFSVRRRNIPKGARQFFVAQKASTLMKHCPSSTCGASDLYKFEENKFQRTIGNCMMSPQFHDLKIKSEGCATCTLSKRFFQPNTAKETVATTVCKIDVAHEHLEPYAAGQRIETLKDRIDIVTYSTYDTYVSLLNRQ